MNMQYIVQLASDTVKILIVTIVDTCSPVKYTPRPVEKLFNGTEYICKPTEDIRLCPNIVDVNGRCCKGLATPKNVSYDCSPKIEKGEVIKVHLSKSDYTFCGFG